MRGVDDGNWHDLNGTGVRINVSAMENHIQILQNSLSSSSVQHTAPYSRERLMLCKSAIHFPYIPRHALFLFIVNKKVKLSL